MVKLQSDLFKTLIWHKTRLSRFLVKDALGPHHFHLFWMIASKLYAKLVKSVQNEEIAQSSPERNSTFSLFLNLVVFQTKRKVHFVDRQVKSGVRVYFY